MVDFSAVLCDFDGEPISDGSEAKAPFTLGKAAVRALVIPHEDERHLSEEAKFLRGALAAKIHNATAPLALKAEDTALLKKLIGKAYSPLIVFRAWPLLDAAETSHQLGRAETHKE